MNEHKKSPEDKERRLKNLYSKFKVFMVSLCIYLFVTGSVV